MPISLSRIEAVRLSRELNVQGTLRYSATGLLYSLYPAVAASTNSPPDSVHRTVKALVARMHEAEVDERSRGKGCRAA